MASSRVLVGAFSSEHRDPPSPTAHPSPDVNIAVQRLANNLQVLALVQPKTVMAIAAYAEEMARQVRRPKPAA